MTILQTLSENETKENTLFDININEIYIQYHHNGKEYELKTHNLKEFYSIHLTGIND